MIRRTPPAVRAVKTPERRLAWALTAGGSALVATATSLYDGELALPWTSVEKVRWVPPRLVLVETSDVEGQGAERSWELAEEGRLPELVRARVTSSVGWTDRRRLPNGRHVRLVGRRVPDADALTWQVVWEDAGDADDPLLRAQVDAWVVELRRSIG